MHTVKLSATQTTSEGKKQRKKHLVNKSTSVNMLNDVGSKE